MHTAPQHTAPTEPTRKGIDTAAREIRMAREIKRQEAMQRREGPQRPRIQPIGYRGQEATSWSNPPPVSGGDHDPDQPERTFVGAFPEAEDDLAPETAPPAMSIGGDWRAAWAANAPVASHATIQRLLDEDHATLEEHAIEAEAADITDEQQDGWELIRRLTEYAQELEREIELVYQSPVKSGPRIDRMRAAAGLTTEYTYALVNRDEIEPIE